MKEGIHPENYRLVAFKDMSNNDIFITKSTVESKDSIEHEGVTYPLVKLEISRTSHHITLVKLSLLILLVESISLKIDTPSLKNKLFLIYFF